MESLELKEIYESMHFSRTKPENEEEILTSIANFAKSIQFPEVQINIEPVKLAGGVLGFGRKKEDVAVVIICTFKKMKKLRGFFRVQNFGNQFMLSMYSSTSSGLFDRLQMNTAEERLEAIKLKLTDVALLEYFQAFNLYMEFIFDHIKNR